MIRENTSFKMLVGRYYINEIQIIYMFLLAIVILLFFFFSKFFTSSQSFFAKMTVIATFVCFFTSHLREFFRKKFDAIVFTPLWIEIGKKAFLKVSYADIQKITLDYWAQRWDFGFGRLVWTGHENTIKIITKDGKKIVKNIRIENDADYWRFKSLGDFLKEKGVEVEMKGFSRSRLTWKAN